MPRPAKPPVTVRGTLELVPNPCTTRPCLPGLALAVVADGVPRFLTRGGSLWTEGQTRFGEMPATGSPVHAVGTQREQRDVNGRAYLTIEFESITPA